MTIDDKLYKIMDDVDKTLTIENLEDEEYSIDKGVLLEKYLTDNKEKKFLEDFVDSYSKLKENYFKKKEELTNEDRQKINYLSILGNSVVSAAVGFWLGNLVGKIIDPVNKALYGLAGAALSAASTAISEIKKIKKISPEEKIIRLGELEIQHPQDITNFLHETRMAYFNKTYKEEYKPYSTDGVFVKAKNFIQKYTS